MPMSRALYLAVDCSTTAAKALLFDTAGRSAAVARRPLAMSQPRIGWHEQDPEDWWRAIREAMVEVIGSIDDPRRIRAVCVTHQRESFVCLDAEGRALRPAILWVDTRATAEIAEFGTPEVAELSGKPADVTPALYKMAWLRRHEPAVLRDAVRVGDVQAFVSQRLTGRWATSHGSADALGLFDLAALTWAEQLLDIAGVRRDQLPDLVPSGELLAMLHPEVAADLGLPAPIPLVAGTGDGQAAGLGADAGGRGTAYVNLGTSMVTGIASTVCVTDSAFRTLAGPTHATYVLETLLNSAGYLTSWFRDRFGAATTDTDVDTAAGRIAAGCEGLLTLPYWNAVQSPYWDPLARGATVGWHSGHTAAHFYRSLLEGVAYELRLHLEGLENATLQPITSLHAVGGGTNSQLWVQIVADVTQRQVLLSNEGEVSAKGAAVLAHAHIANHGNLGIAASSHSMASAIRTLTPNADAARVYSASYAIYRDLYPRLRSGFAGLAALRGDLGV
jgi:xylulokinase